MRYFRRLRGAGSLERVFLFVGVVLVELSYAVNLLFSRESAPDTWRVGVIVANLGLLCLVGAFAVRLYSTRFRQPDMRPFSLGSWQSLVWVNALVAALPICAIVLAVVIPPTSHAFEIVFPISIIGAVVLLVAYILMFALRREGK